jgi:hypothetical protein
MGRNGLRPVVETDHMTEGTADAVIRCAGYSSAQTGIKVDRQPVPYPELVRRSCCCTSNQLPDIIYIDN